MTARRLAPEHDKRGRVRRVICGSCGATWRPSWRNFRRLSSALERALAASDWMRGHRCATQVGEAA